MFVDLLHFKLGIIIILMSCGHVHSHSLCGPPRLIRTEIGTLFVQVKI